jgi:hypothetical protein
MPSGNKKLINVSVTWFTIVAANNPNSILQKKEIIKFPQEFRLVLFSLFVALNFKIMLKKH